jgi:hypothetical protein
MHSLNALRKITLLVFGILMFNVCFGQENYLQAYIVDHNGDTVHGFIDYRNWGKNPDRILFKNQLTDQPIVHTPLSIRNFCVVDEVYASAKILNDLSPVITDELEYGKDPNLKPDTIFLQSIVLGKKSLYLYKNTMGKELFYIGQDTAFTLLEYKRYLNEAEVTTVKENKRYLNQLAVYLNDCPTIQQDFKSLQYTRKSIEKLFLSYYKCVGSPLTFHKKGGSSRTEFGVIAGLTFNNLEFDPALVYNRNEMDFSTTASYTLALFANIVLDRNQGKWSLYNELAFSPYKVEDYTTLYYNENNYTDYTMTFGYSYLKLNTMARFKYPVGKAFVFLNAGMSNAYAIHETNQVLAEKTDGSSVTSEKSDALYVTQRYEQGLLAGIGAVYDRYSFECRYERGNGMSAMINLDSKTTRYLFLLGYKFK